MGVDWRPHTEKEVARMSESPPENEPVPAPVENGTDRDAPDLSHIEYEEEPEYRDPLNESEGEND